MLLILFIKTERKCLASPILVGRLLLYYGNQTGELTPLFVSQSVRFLVNPKLRGVISDFDGFLKPFTCFLIILRRNRHKT